MDNLPDFLQLLKPANSSDALRTDETVEDYLDFLCAPLIGSVPYRERLHFRLEAHDHIAGLIADFQEQGRTRSQAIQEALEEFGEPGRLGHDFLQEWAQGPPRLGARAVVQATAIRAFAFFGIATVFNLFATQYYAEKSRYWPELFPLVFTLALLSPILSGYLTGLALPARIWWGVSCAILICIFASTAVGLMMLPQREGLFFALFQLFFWLPAGCLSVQGTAYLVRQHRCLHFWRSARRAN